jgi:mannose-6-phosphate isomerase-like protein (cupin superfamily)
LRDSNNVVLETLLRRFIRFRGDYRPSTLRLPRKYQSAFYPDFLIVLVLMKANTQMSQHHVDARISIHSLQGRIRIHLPDQNVDLATGELVALEYGIPHDVEALEESAFLITISWPGGTKEERHAMLNQT